MPHSLLTLIAIVLLAGFNVQCRPSTSNANEGEATNQVSSPSPQVQPGDGFLERSFTNAAGSSMRYLLLVPKGYDKQQKYPMVLWLHGGGSRGDDLKLLLGHGNQHGLGLLARPDTQTRFPSLIVAPQCPADKYCSDPDSDQPTKEMKLILEIVDRVRSDYSVDENRIYVTGISLGGYGTWDIITRRPGMFAAAVPICGGGNPDKAQAMIKTAVWAFHGDEDEVVDVSGSRKMIAALKKAGANPRYTEYKGVGHNSWVRAFAEPELLPWMFAQKKQQR